MRRNKVHNVSQFFPKQSLEEFSLQRLMKPIIVVAQCFSLFPLTGVTKTVDELKFEWISFRTLYTLFTIVLHWFLAIVGCVDLMDNLDNFLGLAGIIWWIRTVMESTILLKIAFKWPILLRKWREMEKDMLDYGPLMQLRRKFRIIPLIYLTVGIVEHSMYVYQTSKLVLTTKKGNESLFEKYIVFLNEGFFKYFSYHMFYGILIEFSALTATFMWQFRDLLIILLSTALAERFQQLNTAIKINQNLTELHWRDIRKQYNELSLLCKAVNSIIGDAILISFFGNVYFLSIAFFQNFTPKTAVEGMFTWFSIGFHCFRVMFLCLHVARVHEESIVSLLHISSLPIRNISHEVDRLFNQMSTRSIAIGGSGLFKVTRGLILNISGIVITLQLIFAQFKAKFDSKMSYK